MNQRPSAFLASLAVLMLAAGLLLFYFARGAPPAPDLQTPSGPAPSLSQAIADRNLAALKAALAAGADVNAPLTEGPNSGMTPLHLAAAAPASSVDAIRALVAAGATVDARTPDGRTPLTLAAEFGRPESIAALANVGAALDARDATGKTPLLFAAAAGRADNAQALLTAGASVNAADDAGATALAAACSSRADARVLNILLTNGADADTADAAGLTPLMRAADTAQPDKVLALLNAGASTKARAADGRSALDRARAREGDAAKRCAEVLEQAGP